MIKLLIAVLIILWLAGCYYMGCAKGADIYRDVQVACAEGGGFLEVHKDGRWDCVFEDVAFAETLRM